MTNSTRADAIAAPAPSIADPAPLGLAAFAATTLMLSAVNAHWIAQSSAPAVLAMALCYGGIIQVLAGMWEFRRGNTFGAVAFSSFGGFWLSFWAFNQFFAAGIPAGEVGDAVGMYLLVWAIFTTYMLVASLRVNVSVALVFLTLAVTYWLLMAGNYSNSTNLIKIGGWVGALTAVLAFYASFAGVVNDSWKRTLLPVGPLAPAPAERSQSAERNAQAS
jgi:succinate-acetate transporter protein